MAISLNYTSFASATTMANLIHAMDSVMTTGYSERLKNRKGENWLLVTLVKDTLGYRFAFIDTEGREVGDMVLKAAVRCWSDEAAVDFWRLNAMAYDITVHPLVMKAREEAQRTSIYLIKATHKVTTYGGATLGYGLYKRDWLGRKRLWLTADSTGKPLEVACKVAKEALPMIARVEALV